jgi:hypothetical protein
VGLASAVGSAQTLGIKDTRLYCSSRHGIQMPVRLANVYETIMYEYAKLIADQAVEERKTLAPAERTTKDYWSFVALTFKKLKDERCLTIRSTGPIAACG